MSEVTDWISASADVAAAVGTVGALWVGAVTLRRQVNDQHRQQAAAVTVAVQKGKYDNELLVFSVQNDSPFPVFEVVLIATDHGKDFQNEFVATLPPGKITSFTLRDTHFMGCRATFYDSSGKRWVRDFTGPLKEITPKKPNLFRRLYLVLFTHNPK
ncbi:hypothetical protein [Pseudarthrobacter sp. fls2-241-R2A-168]|uniref:hypothetical protein n=1 Tax=Pseudarthrobacter sp. fls2-241-R2A-168 TaxID=3040304 RepID=UPI00255630C7|nr:hypothetical protein [Pseudarthrobacter sp. fls2-241-R2A-168]